MKQSITLFFLLIFISSYSLVAQTYTTIPFFEDFESAELANYWITNPDNANNGLIDIANNWGVGESYGLRLGKSSDGGDGALNSIDLHLDLTAVANSELVFNFQVRDHYDDNHIEDGVYFSDDGGNTFTKITEINFYPETWTDNWYANIRPYGYDFDELMSQYDLSYTNNFIIRFQQFDYGDFSTSGDEDGITIDNINLYFDAPFAPASVPYYQDFESSDDLADYPEFVRSNDKVGGYTADNNMISRFANLGIANNWGYNESYGLVMGKWSDGEGGNINALDLHLDLSSVANSELVFNFQVRDHYDDNNIEDGVYFSDDGGNTFTKITEINFYPETWTDNWYANIRPYGYDFDELMSQYDLSYTNNFIIRFQQFDYGDFSTSGDEDGITIDNINLYFDAPFAPASVPYYQDFESSDDLADYPEFVRSNDKVGGYTADNNMISRFANLGIANNWGYNESYGLVMGKWSDGEGGNINALDLHLDLSSVVDSQLVFNFQVRDYYDDNNIEDGVYFSDDGGNTFTKITEINFYPETWTDNWYANIRPYGYDFDELMSQYDLSYTNDFVIRFQQFDYGDFSTSGDEDGITIDNINLYFDAPFAPASVPYYQDFESSDDLADYPEFVRSNDKVGGYTADNNMISRFANLGIVNNWGHNESYGLVMGKWSDGEGGNINALDLHLDLSSVVDSQLVFNFQIRDYFDDNHIEDGVYFSDDGGNTFTKVTEMNFYPETWTDNWYGNIRAYGYDFDELMSQYDMNYTNDFVIRFQQFDYGDFSSSGDEDGITIDNINLYFDKKVEYQKLPFCDNFFETCISTNNCPLSNAWYINSTDALYAENPTCFQENTLNRYARLQITNGASSDEDGYSLYLGKWNDNEGYNTNALDLHLDLSENVDEEIVLSFDFLDVNDETHLEDAIFLSADGGVTWEKVYNFQPESFGDDFHTVVINISDEIQASNQLSFSNQFVVRFQQYDNADFDYSSDEDGFVIDNVEVYANDVTCDCPELLSLYPDIDGDGLGDGSADALISCEEISNYVTNNSDVDDSIFCPSNEIDECGICNGTGASIWYADNDNDGFGNASESFESCDQPSGYVLNNEDTDDGITCVSNLIDECGICDGPGASTWYADIDNDGLGDPVNTLISCDEPTGYVTNNNDNNDAVPTNTEILNTISKLQLYPNPASEFIHLEFYTDISENAILNIYDIQGKRIEEIMINVVNGTNSFVIDISKLNNGLYLLNIQIKGVQTTTSFIVE